MILPRPIAVLIAMTAATAVVTACGGGDDDSPPQRSDTGGRQSAFERQLAAASQVTAADFPPANGQTLEQLGATAQPGAEVGLATSVLEPGTNRLAFGVIGEDTELVYGQSAVYVARGTGGRAAGPYPAPADRLVTGGAIEAVKERPRAIALPLSIRRASRSSARGNTRSSSSRRPGAARSGR